MLGSRLYLAAVALGTVACFTTVSECQKILIDLPSVSPGTCDDYCDFYGNRFPLICYNADLVECILRVNPGHCAEDPVAKCLIYVNDLSSAGFEKSCAELCDWYGNKYPHICGNVDLIDCMLQWHSDQCAARTTTTTTTTTPRPSTTTTTEYIYHDLFPLQCVASACYYRVRGRNEVHTGWCKTQCDKVIAAGVCPEATNGEEFLMKCVEEFEPLCWDPEPEMFRICDFPAKCVVEKCKERVKEYWDGNDYCPGVCERVYKEYPADCNLQGRGDEALADCVAKHNPLCLHPSSGSRPLCVPAAFSRDAM